MGNNDILNEKLIDLELAKSYNKNTKVKKYLPLVAIAASWYYSLFLCGGLIIGYLGSKIYSMHTLEKGKVDSIYVECGKWKIHLHHWIMGGVVLALMYFVYQFPLTGFIAGMLLGVMAHDIYDFNDWHKVLIRNENYKEKK